MCGSAMLAMDVSSTCMKVASITPSAISQGLWRGRHSSWETTAAIKTYRTVGNMAGIVKPFEVKWREQTDENRI